MKAMGSYHIDICQDREVMQGIIVGDLSGTDSEQFNGRGNMKSKGQHNRAGNSYGCRAG